jgi:hypothetical protein
MKGAGYLVLFLLVGLFIPLGIWVAAVRGFYERRQQAKLSRKAIPSWV